MTLVKVVGIRIVRRRIALGEDSDNLPPTVRVGRRLLVNRLHERYGLLSPDIEGLNCARKEHGIADRQDRQFIAEL